MKKKDLGVFQQTDKWSQLSILQKKQKTNKIEKSCCWGFVLASLGNKDEQASSSEGSAVWLLSVTWANVHDSLRMKEQSNATPATADAQHKILPCLSLRKVAHAGVRNIPTWSVMLQERGGGGGDSESREQEER